jgi:hypothetical protein
MVKFLRSALFNGLLCHVYTRNIACILHIVLYGALL